MLSVICKSANLQIRIFENVQICKYVRQWRAVKVGDVDNIDGCKLLDSAFINL